MPSYHRYFYTTPSRRFIEALSENGYLYGILWPIIIHQALKFELDRLQCVNRFFAKHAGLARTRFILDDYRETKMEETPVHLDFEVLRNVECICWGADKLYFKTVENFRTFCALGDVDPDEGATSFELNIAGRKETFWMFASRTRDIVFETCHDNPVLDEIPYAHYFGITGRKDKLWAMYEFVNHNCEGYEVWGERPFI